MRHVSVKTKILIAAFSLTGALVCDGQEMGKCKPDSNKPAITCRIGSISWDDTSHCQSDYGTYICYPYTSSITHHSDIITWSHVLVMNSWQQHDHEYGWSWDPVEPAGYTCVTDLGEDPDLSNMEDWDCSDPTEHDTTSTVQGAFCSQVQL
jgi:hypothetical protein